MRVTVLFDVEDYVTPPEGGLDDLLKMLAEVMTEEDVSGTFFVIGEKLRCLRDRGRDDVIAALARHDMGSHVNMGSIHPTVVERMEGADWADGVSRMAADELGGIEELSALAGRPLRSLARHGGSFSPQLVAALGRREVAYVYSPARLPGHNITWYCNALNFYEAFTSFQQAYLSRAAFLEAEKQFMAFLAEHREYEWCMLFHSHPCMIKTAWFWDTNYFKGVNTPPEKWKTPDFRPEFSLAAARENWAFHCGRLRENDELRLGTIAEFSEEFGRQAEDAGREEIQALARTAADATAPFWTDRFSAAEVLDLLARAVLARGAGGDVPERVARRDVLGPSQMPLSAPTTGRFLPEALHRVARGIMAAVGETGMLPSRIRCGEGTLGSPGEIGPGSALVAFGRALGSSDVSRAVTTQAVAPYPAEGEALAAAAREFKNWPCHRLDLDMSRIALLSALQSWTLKPAWPGGPPEFRG